MRKIITVEIIVIAIIARIFFINAYESDVDIMETATKVGVIFNGNKDDKNWSQSHYEGIVKTAQQLNLEIIYKEFLTTDSIMCVIEEFAESGCEIVIANSAIYGEQIVKAAERYPEIFFFHATGTSSNKNLSTYFGRMYQMRYLTGIAAGLQTETNEIRKYINVVTVNGEYRYKFLKKSE